MTLRNSHRCLNPNRKTERKMERKTVPLNPDAKAERYTEKRNILILFLHLNSGCCTVQSASKMRTRRP